MKSLTETNAAFLLFIQIPKTVMDLSLSAEFARPDVSRILSLWNTKETSVVEETFIHGSYFSLERMKMLEISATKPIDNVALFGREVQGLF